MTDKENQSVVLCPFCKGWLTATLYSLRLSFRPVLSRTVGDRFLIASGCRSISYSNSFSPTARPPLHFESLQLRKIVELLRLRRPTIWEPHSMQLRFDILARRVASSGFIFLPIRSCTGQQTVKSPYLDSCG